MYLYLKIKLINCSRLKLEPILKKAYLLLLLFFICTMTFAQSSGVISGLVADKSNQPIERATIVLLSLPDSVMVKGVVTDQKGFFSLNQIKDGKYVLRSSYIGFKSNAKQVLISSPKRVFSRTCFIFSSPISSLQVFCPGFLLD